MTYWVRVLLVANIAMYVLVRAVPFFELYMPLYPGFVLRMPWTLITHQFVHASFYHIFFNMWALYMFGSPVESRLGSKHFIGLYLVSGVMGALLSVLLVRVAPFGVLVGASGAVLGVVLVFARYWPDARLLLLFVIPVSAVAVASLVLGVLRIPEWMGHFAHLGGLMGAFLYLRVLAHYSPAERFKRKTYENIAPSMKTDASLLTQMKQVDLSQLHALNREEFVRLMQKIETDGLGALSLEDRAFLNRFS
jgi:membrane associated rhomboid family serine protease